MPSAENPAMSSPFTVLLPALIVRPVTPAPALLHLS
jgi:hypothetical protein